MSMIKRCVLAYITYDLNYINCCLDYISCSSTHKFFGLEHIFRKPIDGHAHGITYLNLKDTLFVFIA